MDFLGVSGMHYSGVSLKGNRIILAEDSVVFNKLIKQRIKELLEIDIEVCRNYEELQLANEREGEPIRLAISNLNLPGAEQGEALNYLVDVAIPTIVFTGTLQDATRDKLLSNQIVDYIIKDSVFAVDMLVEAVCRFLTNHTHHVLIVDDSQTARALLTTRLKRYNFKVSAAENGQKALDIIKANRDISLMITDYNMPDIDGFELTRRVRAHIGSHQLRIIGVSSSTDRLLSARFLKAGGNDFMMRPFIDEEFYCRVNQNLDTLSQMKLLLSRQKKAS
jgi:PleD family two-component response regulator